MSSLSSRREVDQSLQCAWLSASSSFKGINRLLLSTVALESIKRHWGEGQLFLGNFPHVFDTFTRNSENAVFTFLLFKL